MHLDTKAILFLISPFLVTAGVWFFATDPLIEGISQLFDPIIQEQAAILDEKGEAYRLIAQHKEGYQSLLQKIILRNAHRAWISNRLYHPYIPETPTVTPHEILLKPPPPLLSLGDGNLTAPKPMGWSVQMVLPEQNIAIINNRIFHVGQRVDGIELLQVDASKVYIKTSKGSQWVTLFH
ncbi:MAG: hypothetical protein WA080_05485 [Sulfuricurvum sp.]